MPGGSEHGNVLSQGSGGWKPQITVWTGPCPAETWGGRVSSPPSSFWQWPCILVPVTASPRPSSCGLLPAPVSSSKDTVVLAPGPPQRHHVFQDSTSNSGHVHLSFCGGGAPFRVTGGMNLDLGQVTVSGTICFSASVDGFHRGPLTFEVRVK